MNAHAPQEEVGAQIAARHLEVHTIPLLIVELALQRVCLTVEATGQGCGVMRVGSVSMIAEGGGVMRVGSVSMVAEGGGEDFVDLQVRCSRVMEKERPQWSDSSTSFYSFFVCL